MSLIKIIEKPTEEILNEWAGKGYALVSVVSEARRIPMTTNYEYVTVAYMQRVTIPVSVEGNPLQVEVISLPETRIAQNGSHGLGDYTLNPADY